MARARKPAPVKLICGMIANDRSLFDESASAMEGRFGRTDIRSDVYDFDSTSYYEREMGSPLWRQFVSFAKTVDPGELAEAKIFSNELELRIAESHPGLSPRPINLDVGYLEPAKLVLASMKNFAHRVYVGKGVYAEPTLAYHKDAWQTYAWTFPDYASQRYRSFMEAARRNLMQER